MYVPISKLTAAVASVNSSFDYLSFFLTRTVGQSPREKYIAKKKFRALTSEPNQKLGRQKERERQTETKLQQTIQTLI